MKVTETVKKIPYLFSDEQSYLKSAMKNYHQNIVLFEMDEIHEALLKCCDICEEKSLHLCGSERDAEYYFELKLCTSYQCGWSQYYLYLPYKKYVCINDEEYADDCEEFENCKFLSNAEIDYANDFIEWEKVPDFNDF